MSQVQTTIVVNFIGDVNSNKILFSMTLSNENNFSEYDLQKFFTEKHFPEAHGILMDMIKHPVFEDGKNVKIFTQRMLSNIMVTVVQVKS